MKIKETIIFSVIFVLLLLNLYYIYNFNRYEIITSNTYFLVYDKKDKDITFHRVGSEGIMYDVGKKYYDFTDYLKITNKGKGKKN